MRNGFREGWKKILVPPIIIFNTFGVMLAIPAQDFWYFYETSLLAIPSLLFSFILFSVENPKGENSDLNSEND